VPHYPPTTDTTWWDAYHAGYQDALTHAAARVDDLDWLWQPIPRPSREQRIAAEIDAMLDTARTRAAATGRPWRDFHGRGCPGWNTALPPCDGHCPALTRRQRAVPQRAA
jgi:hypothetical protein